MGDIAEMYDYDYWDFEPEEYDRYEREDYYPRAIVCLFCDARDLFWRELPSGKFHLVTAEGKHHNCPQYKTYKAQQAFKEMI